jgi:hypothetical protein
MEARLELAAHDLLPGHVGLDARLQRRGIDPALGEARGELLRRHAHALAHFGESLLHVALGDLQLVALADLQLELLVDQLVDHLLADRRLVGDELVEARALLDVIGGDRVAIDQNGDVLRRRQARRGDGGRSRDRDHDGVAAASEVHPQTHAEPVPSCRLRR